MSPRAQLAEMKELLRRDPAMQLPPVHPASADELRAAKDRSRAFDQARIELNLATPEQVQSENSAVRIDRKAQRVVRFAQYA